MFRYFGDVPENYFEPEEKDFFNSTTKDTSMEEAADIIRERNFIEKDNPKEDPLY